jgi:hypothetical protein
MDGPLIFAGYLRQKEMRNSSIELIVEVIYGSLTRGVWSLYVARYETLSERSEGVFIFLEQSVFPDGLSAFFAQPVA